MFKRLTKWTMILAIVLVPGVGHADNPSREFIASCTYGVLAGTLVGAASLAFTNSPGDSLNHVARGASIGLYTGILLGIYVVYIVPGMNEGPEESAEDPVVRWQRTNFLLEPLLSQNRIDGLAATVNLLRF